VSAAPTRVSSSFLIFSAYIHTLCLTVRPPEVYCRLILYDVHSLVVSSRGDSSSRPVAFDELYIFWFSYRGALSSYLIVRSLLTNPAPPASPLSYVSAPGDGNAVGKADESARTAPPVLRVVSGYAVRVHPPESCSVLWQLVRDKAPGPCSEHKGKQPLLAYDAVLQSHPCYL